MKVMYARAQSMKNDLKNAVRLDWLMCVRVCGMKAILTAVGKAMIRQIPIQGSMPVLEDRAGILSWIFLTRMTMAIPPPDDCDDNDPNIFPGAPRLAMGKTMTATI